MRQGATRCRDCGSPGGRSTRSPRRAADGPRHLPLAAQRSREWRTVAPTSTAPSARSSPSRPVMPLMSTRWAGAARRKLSSGTRLWPPATTFASSPARPGAGSPPRPTWAGGRTGASSLARPGRTRPMRPAPGRSIRAGPHQPGADLPVRPRPAIPVLMIGTTPVRTTRSTSIPKGHREPRAGSVGRVCSASVTSYISSVQPRASPTSPPTSCTMAGAPAMANPPSPTVSVIAESPMSALASSGPNPPR